MTLDNMTLDEVKFWSKGFSDAMLAIEKYGLYRCPECKHFMTHPSRDFNICPVCRAEFGYGTKEQDCERIWGTNQGT